MNCVELHNQLVKPQIKEIPSCSGYYADERGNLYSDWCNYGRGRSFHAIKPIVRSNYLTVSVKNNEKRRYVAVVSRLVCEAFHGPPPSLSMQASHLNGINTDNRPDNLMWETTRENLLRKREHGTDDWGVNNSRAKVGLATLERIWVMRHFDNNKQKEIANQLGLHRVFVTKVLNLMRYKRDSISICQKLGIDILRWVRIGEE